MEFSRAELKEMIGKRVTVDGVRGRVVKISAKDNTLTTETKDGDMVVVNTADIYRRGPGYFSDVTASGKPSKKVKASKKVEDEKPTKKAKKVKEEVEEKPVRGRTKAAKKAEEKPVKKSKKAKAEDFDDFDDELDEVPVKKAKTPKAKKVKPEPEVKTKVPRGKKAAAQREQAAAKKNEFKFAQANVTSFVSALSDLLAEYLPEVEPKLVLSSSGASFNSELISVSLGFTQQGLDKAKVTEILEEASVTFGTTAADDGEFAGETDDDFEGFDDDSFEDEDEVDEEAADSIDDEEDEDEDEDYDDEDGEAQADEKIVSKTAKLFKLDTDELRDIMEEFLNSEEIDEAFGDELVPGVTQMEHNGKEYTILGYEEGKCVLGNVKTKKLLRTSIKKVARMEFV